MLMCLGLAGPALAQSTMTDKQVMEYVQTGLQQGKSQQQLSTELARRGVTKEQAERVKKLYEQQKGDSNNALAKPAETPRTRINQGDNTRTVPIRDEQQADQLSFVTEDVEGVEVTKQLATSPEERIFGRDVFNTQNLSFEPSGSMATPPNYRLGPGDEVIIDIWGSKQTTIRQTISPDGNINVDGLGLVSLNGMTVSGATSYLRKALNQIYEGIDGDNPTSELKVTLGNNRTIQINIMGEVLRPGTYALSAFSTVFHALYMAGGVSQVGSLRNIQVSRGGHIVGKVDVYEFIMQGKTGDDIRLQEGDVIIVPPYDVLVKIEGNVKRPMKYEMKKNESVQTLLKYAGNFSSDAYQRSVRVVRQNGREYQVNTVDDIDFSVFQMKDGDVVTVDAILDRFENKLEIKGAVYRPGVYQYSNSLNTVRQLVEKADGLMGDAFSGRAVLRRENADLSHETMQIDIKGILNGSKPDVPLMRNDVLYIPSIHDLVEEGTFSIYGEVTRPGLYAYADHTTIEDLVIMAGGLTEAASLVRVDVNRRVKNDHATAADATIGQMFTFSLKDGFIVDGEQGFYLEPYDEVYVRRSPGYQSQQNVTVEGEVLYDGTYALTNKTERLSDLIQKAGGATQFAYVKGAKLMRRANPEEIKRMQDVIKLLQREMGVTNMDSLKLDVDSLYSVGIDLEKALKNPGGSADLVLREGDRLIVPELTNTVKVNGAVLVTNTVSYKDGKNVNYYIGQAGGYANGARKHKKFIIYMNGQVAKAKGKSVKAVEPGCEIVVPVKDKTKAGQWNLQSIIGIASSLGSLGLTAASIANILK
jgi:protein involved in polysaccharide export with SLBB domain